VFYYRVFLDSCEYTFLRQPHSIRGSYKMKIKLPLSKRSTAAISNFLTECTVVLHTWRRKHPPKPILQSRRVV